MFEKITEITDIDGLTKVVHKSLSKQNYTAATHLLQNEFIKKNKKLVFYGAGLHTEMIIEILSKDERKVVVGIIDNNKSGKIIHGFLVQNINELKCLDCDFIILSSDIHQKSMRVELTDFGFENKKLIDIYEHPSFFHYALQVDYCDIGKEIEKINSSNNPLVFLATSYQLNHIGLFKELSKHYDLFVFTMSDRVSRSISIDEFANEFYIFKLYRLQDMLYLASRISKGKIISVHGWMDNSFSATVLAYSKVEVYCMLIDILSSMFDNAKDAKKMLGDDAEEEFFCEEICWKYSSGYIHKDHEMVLSSLKDRYGDRRALHFLFYICGDDILKSTAHQIVEPLKIVYMGGIHAIKDQNDSSAIHKSFIDVIKIVTDQGYELHAYNAYDDGATDKWNEYVDESRQNTRFFYYLAVSPRELHEKLQEYDIALSVFDYSGRITKDECHKYGFSTRIVPFMEAGIPIINSNEMEYTVKIIEDYGVGVGIEYDELYDLPKVIEKMNLDRCRKNMIVAKEALSYKNNIHKFVSFISDF
jgi:hypothetical protein